MTKSINISPVIVLLATLFLTALLFIAVVAITTCICQQIDLHQNPVVMTAHPRYIPLLVAINDAPQGWITAEEFQRLSQATNDNAAKMYAHLFPGGATPEQMYRCARVMGSYPEGTFVISFSPNQREDAEMETDLKTLSRIYFDLIEGEF